MIAKSWHALRVSGAPWHQFATLILLAFIAALLDAFGISMFLPLLAYISGGLDAVFSQVPWPLDHITRLLTDMAPDHALEILMAATALPMVLRYGVTYWQSAYAMRVSYQVTRRLRAGIYRAVLGSDMSFHSQRNTGALQTQILAYSQQVGNVVQALSNFVVQSLLALGYGAVLIYLSPSLALLVAPVLIVIVALYKRLMSQTFDVGKAFNEDTALLTTELTQQLQGIRLIKLRHREAACADRLQVASDRNLGLYFAVQRLNLLVASTINPALMLAGAVMIYGTVRWLGAGLAELGVFAIALLRLLPIIGALNVVRANLYTLFPVVEVYSASLAAALNGRTLRSGTLPCPGIAAGITFEDVSFAYPATDETHQPAIRSVSLQIPRGHTVALVGRSGAGKSTIVDLLARLQDPTAGRILLDGHALPDLRLADLRRRIALVSQDSFLFDDTVRANIAFGSDTAIDDEAIVAALQAANAWDFVQAMPQGLDSMVGERGGRLSGGQRQRLSLARGLAQKPDLLILDEPTSALDSESEEAIQRVLESLHGHITIVIVAHRLTTIRNADLIHVLDGGALVASGSHEQLIAGNALYKRLFETQAQTG